METKPQIPQRIEGKKEKIKSADISSADRLIHLNGIVYIPRPQFDHQTKSKIGKEIYEKPWFKKLLVDNHDFKSGPENSMADLRNILRSAHGDIETEESKEDGSFYAELCDKLVDFYLKFKYENNGEDPVWLGEVNIETRKFLAFQLFANKSMDDFPPYLRFSRMQYAGINSFAIENVSMFEDLHDVFKLGRLQLIKQLSLLRDPASAIIGGGEDFPHTRYGHSFDVLAIANLLGINAKLSLEDLRILQIAAVSHDFRTPAGGDVTKLIDPEAFDEDKHYGEIFETKEWKAFAKKYGISKEQEEKLYQVIQGEGVMGKLLDLADKLAYVARDADVYLNEIMRVIDIKEMEDGAVSYNDKPELQSIKNILESDPLVCNVWDSVEIINGQVVVTNVQKLSDFLKLRALLFKELYYNYVGRFSVYMFAKEIIKYLYETGKLKQKEFLEGGDSMLMAYLEKFIGSQMFPILTKPRNAVVERCLNIKEARKFAASFNNDSEKIAIIDDFSPISNSGTNKFKVKNNDKIVSFNEAFPEEAGKIDSLMVPPLFINVYVMTFKDLGIPRSHQEKIKDIFRVSS